MDLKVKYLTFNHGLPYYQRSVPPSLRAILKLNVIKIPLKLSLSTKEVSSGLTVELSLMAQVNRLSGEHTSLFNTLQSSSLDYKEELPLNIRPAVAAHKQVMLSKALEIYLSNHERGRDAKFIKYAKFKWDAFLAIVKDMPLEYLSRSHAKIYRDSRFEQGVKTASIRRELNTLAAIVRKAFLEMEIDRNNPLSSIQIAGFGQDSVRREPFNQNQLKVLIDDCLKLNDDKRRLLLLIALTGMRLNEAIGLRYQDIVLSENGEGISYLVICPHSKRRLKTKESQREIPLSPLLSQVVNQQLESANENYFLFPSFVNEKGTLSDSLSSTLNKYIQVTLGIPKSIHCLRHTMRDLLREAGITKDVIDSIGGWTSGDISSLYGHGHSLKMKLNALTKAYEYYENNCVYVQ